MGHPSPWTVHVGLHDNDMLLRQLQNIISRLVKPGCLLPVNQLPDDRHHPASVHLAVDRRRKLLDPPRQLPRLRWHVLHYTHVDQINSSPVVVR